MSLYLRQWCGGFGEQAPDTHSVGHQRLGELQGKVGVEGPQLCSAVQVGHDRRRGEVAFSDVLEPLMDQPLCHGGNQGEHDILETSKQPHPIRQLGVEDRDVRQGTGKANGKRSIEGSWVERHIPQAQEASQQEGAGVEGIQHGHVERLPPQRVHQLRVTQDQVAVVGQVSHEVQEAAEIAPVSKMEDKRLKNLSFNY